MAEEHGSLCGRPRSPVRHKYSYNFGVTRKYKFRQIRPPYRLPHFNNPDKHTNKLREKYGRAGHRRGSHVDEQAAPAWLLSSTDLMNSNTPSNTLVNHLLFRCLLARFIISARYVFSRQGVNVYS